MNTKKKKGLDLGDPTRLGLLKKKIKGAADLSPAPFFFIKESDMSIVSNQILTIIVPEKSRVKNFFYLETHFQLFFKFKIPTKHSIKPYKLVNDLK